MFITWKIPKTDLGENSFLTVLGPMQIENNYVVELVWWLVRWQWLDHSCNKQWDRYKCQTPIIHWCLPYLHYRTRYIHHVSVTAIYVLPHKAYIYMVSTPSQHPMMNHAMPFCHFMCGLRNCVVRSLKQIFGSSPYSSDSDVVVPSIAIYVALAQLVHWWNLDCLLGTPAF